MREGDGHRILALTAPTALLASQSDVALPILVLLCWVAVVVLIVVPRRRRPPPMDRRDRWSPPMVGPPDADDRDDHGGAVHADQPASAPAPSTFVDVVHAANLPTLPQIAGHRLAATRLDDGVGALLDSDVRNSGRTHVAHLLHGGPVADLRSVTSAIAGEHGVPLLTARATRLVRSVAATGVADVIALAHAQAPCVLAFTDLDAFATLGEPAERRVLHDLLTEVRRLRRGDRIAVVGLAETADAVPRSLRGVGGFEHTVGLGRLTATERATIITREALLHGARPGDDLEASVELTTGCTASQLRTTIATAARSAGSATGPGGPPALTARDLRAAMAMASSTVLIRAFGAGVARPLRSLVRQLDGTHAVQAVAFLAASGNGSTSAARWVARRCGRRVVWLTPGAVAQLGGDGLDAIVEGVAAERTLVVIDDVDVALRLADLDARRRLVTAVRHLAAAPGAALLLTAHDHWVPTWARDLDGQIDAYWLRHPSFHERVDLIRHAVPDVPRSAVAALAAQLAGATRRAVVDAAHAHAERWAA